MSALVIFFVLFFSSICHSTFWPNIKTCLATHHFWRPFAASIPSNAFLAGTDRDGDTKYISRVMDPNINSWLTPGTISMNNLYQIYKAAQQKGKGIYLEVLCVKPPHKGFGWRPTSYIELNTILKDCCLVEGGSGYKNGEHWVTYIGRAVLKNKYYIGEVTPSAWWNILAPSSLVFFDEKGNRYGRNTDFDVLAYECCTAAYCKTVNKAECCYDIVKKR